MNAGEIWFLNKLSIIIFQIENVGSQKFKHLEVENMLKI